MLQIKNGDVVHVRAEVEGTIDGDGEIAIRIKSTIPRVGARRAYCAPSEIVHVETRPLQVGDVVTWGGRSYNYAIRAIVDEKAMLYCDKNNNWIIHSLDQLERV